MSSTSTSAPAYAVWRANPPTSTPSNSTTFVNQPSLPRLPVPALTATLGKLVASCKPLARSPEELAALEKKVAEFAAPGGLGATLQQRLEARREEPGMRNWIAQWWDNDAYMAYRESVVINVSYYYGFSRLPQSPPTAAKKVNEDPAYVAASIITTALEFRNMLASGSLIPDKAGKEGGELCMESFKWAFNACRVPAIPADYAVKVEELAKEGQFLVVVHKNKFWKIDFKDAEGKELGTDGFRKAFQAVYDHSVSTSAKENPAVGILTGLNRDTWTHAQAHLLADTSNAATLEAIQKSAFVFCLDESRPDPSLKPLGTGERRRGGQGIAEFSKRLWKGEEEGGNRWWDKPLQWIVFKNGESGFIGEHSCMDGTPTASLNDFISRRLISDAPTPISAAPSTSSVVPTLLPFKLDAQSLQSIKEGEKEFSQHVGAYDLFYINYGRYGKDGIKKCGVSPDGWTQMIFQLAYYLTHGVPCGTYEAAQVRKFQLGRTETVRICSQKTLAWTKAMVDESASNEKRQALFREAIGGHGKEMKDASSGLGADRHLFGLKKLVQEGENVELFADDLLKRSGTWSMSTSQIYIRNAPSYGWGPVVKEGYGLPYMIHPECLQFTVTCHKDMPGQAMAENLGKAADLVMDLMSAEKVKAKL